jgi:cyclase
MPGKNPYKRGGMFEGASHLIFENAKKLRNTMTDSETFLWMHLRNGINGLKFRRQHPIGLYIADFFCYKVKLIVEIDGSIHNKKEIQIQDKLKEDDLIKWGYHIIRFTNKEVHQDVDKVLERIKDKIIDITISHIQNVTPNREM